MKTFIKLVMLINRKVTNLNLDVFIDKLFKERAMINPITHFFLMSYAFVVFYSLVLLYFLNKYL